MAIDDQTRLRHIRDAATEAIGYVGTKGRDEFLAQRVFVQASIRCIEIIGEAAKGLSEELTNAHPEIPWRKIVAMRNRVIHAYFDIDGEQIWITLKTSIPALLDQVVALIDGES